MTSHNAIPEAFTALWWMLPFVAGAGQIIVGKHWPPPWWPLGSVVPPPGNDFVVVGADFVLVGVDNVVVPSP